MSDHQACCSPGRTCERCHEKHLRVLDQVDHDSRFPGVAVHYAATAGV